MAYLVEDHTLGIISNPVSAPGELLWNFKTFTEENLDRIQVKLFKFPRLDRKPIPEIDPDRPRMPDEVMQKWLNKKCGPSVSGTLKLLINGESFFHRLEEAIKSAQKSIYVNTYIFDNDDVAVQIADRLKERSKSVQVRVILDGIASKQSWVNKPKSADHIPQPEIGDMISYLKEDSKIQVHRSSNRWLSSEHSKSVVIDRELAFFGGMNIGRDYRYDWRDMMVEVQGPLVEIFHNFYMKAWLRAQWFSDFLFYVDKHKRKKYSRLAGEVKCHVLITTPFRHQIYKAQLFAARNAKHHIYVENSYLWNHRYIYALCEARKRGVDVRVTLPIRHDHPFMRGATAYAINTLLHHGVRVFIYPGMTHVKAAVYDDWACFGSANFDDLSMHKNFELNLATSDPVFVKEIEEKLLLQGQRLSKETLKPEQVTFFDSLSWEMKDYL